MVQAISIHQTGGPEVLDTHSLSLRAPGPGEALVRQTWAGVNFVDIYQRVGLYPLPGLPATLGVEAVGVVEALGDGVTGFEPGQRVAWAGPPVGGYAQARIISAERLLPLPDAIGDETAAAALFRGITAHMLLREVRPVGEGDVLLVHAAAGGLGQMLIQWARRLGARTIGVVGGAAKAEIAAAAGADHVIDRTTEDFVAAVRRLTGGRGVDVVYDGVGGETLLKSLDCARPFGLVASIGQAAGALPDIPLTALGPKRSISLARPSVFAYASDPGRYRAAAAAVFEALEDGLQVAVGARFALADAAAAHRALEAGKTSGAILLDLA